MGVVSLDRPIKAERVADGVAQGNQTANLMSVGWTDETHTLYISSMEASFMDQLYNRGRNTNHKDSSGDGFKVLHGGVRNKRTTSCDPVTGKCRLPANPWIQHFRPRDCSSNTRGDGAETSVGDHESGNPTVHGRTPLSHAREVGAWKGENLLGENTEVSDQNFADDEQEVDAESNKACKQRRLGITCTYYSRMIK